ncbi:AraC family transcriptional regulator [Neiella marina]|uniref:AraC family transcriptional regulator n=1 Tax=Neiella marina TaxID=508461 RepID=A0A8J2U841_9GAMM|nr:AraC family transcriptional regulator [Neiella marina]GGA85374.1 AraC family transcriptional regulator [Neiella marina]
MRPILEHIPHSREQSFYAGRYKGQGFTFPWHYHPEWELTYIISGTGTAYTGNAIRHFGDGELALMGPHLPHCWKSNVNDGEQVSSVFIQWSADLLGDKWMEKSEFSAIRKLLMNCESGLLFSGYKVPFIGERMRELVRAKPFERLLAFMALLQDLTTLDAEPISHGGIQYQDNNASKRIENILNYVAANYEQKIDAQQMADLTNMTPVSFSKYFKRVFKKTFTSYLNEYRVTQACGLLIRTDEPVEEIGYRCGYQNMAFFHRQFKTIMKQTPLKYRQQFQAAQG